MEISYMTAQEAHYQSLKNQKFDKEKYQEKLKCAIIALIDDAIEKGKFNTGFNRNLFNESYFMPLSLADIKDNEEKILSAFYEVIAAFQKLKYNIQWNDYENWYDIFW